MGGRSRNHRHSLKSLICRFTFSSSSDRGPRRQPDARRPPHPLPHLSHEEKGRGQLRSVEEAHLQEGPHHRDLRIDPDLLLLLLLSQPHTITHLTPLKTQSGPASGLIIIIIPPPPHFPPAERCWVNQERSPDNTIDRLAPP